MKQLIKYPIPTSYQIEKLADEICSPRSKVFYDKFPFCWISSIQEFYWNDETKWFIMLKDDCPYPNQRYMEVVIKPYFDGDRILYDFIEVATHGSPCMAKIIANFNRKTGEYEFGEND